MESQYLLEITEDSYSFNGIDDRTKLLALDASRRLHVKCCNRDTIVAVHIKNPRYSVKD